MFAKTTHSVSTLIIRALAVLLFVGYFAARYDIFETAKHIPHHVATPVANVIIGIVCNPIYFYCAGLWFLGGVFSRLKRGEAFTPALLTDLKAMAWCLIAGGLLGTFVFPLISALTPLPVMPGPPISFWSRFGFHGVDLTVGLLGIALLVVSRQGQRLRGELDQFV
jgi:hypothetical protein